MTVPNLLHAFYMLLMGFGFVLAAAIVMFKVFDMMSPYNTWKLIEEGKGHVAVFAGLLVLGVTLGAFMYAGHVLG